jgi:hypothetical protein
MQPTQSPNLIGADGIERLRRHVAGSIETKQLLLERCSGQILAAAERMVACFQQGNKILRAETGAAPRTRSTSPRNLSACSRNLSCVQGCRQSL